MLIHINRMIIEGGLWHHMMAALTLTIQVDVYVLIVHILVYSRHVTRTAIVDLWLNRLIIVIWHIC